MIEPMKRAMVCAYVWFPHLLFGVWMRTSRLQAGWFASDGLSQWMAIWKCARKCPVR